MQCALAIILTWDTPLCFSPDRLNRLEMSKIFVCSECLRGKLSIEYVVQFEEIIFLDSCSFKEIQSKLEKYILALDPSNVFLVNVDEDVMLVAAEIREYYGLSGYKRENILPFVDKLNMKEKLKHTDILMPKYLCFSAKSFQKSPKQYVKEVIQTLGLPIFAKPIDGTGSLYTRKILNENELHTWCQQHTHCNRIFELDEYIEAELFHCDTIVENGVITHAYIAKYSNPCFEFLNGKALGTIAVRENSEDCKEIFAFNETVLSAMQVPDNCATHLEVFKKNNGELVFLEIAARTPGVWVSYIHERFLGINSQEAFIYLQLSKAFNDYSSCCKREYGACILFPSQNGIAQARAAFPELKSRYYLQWKIRLGDKLSAPENILTPVCTILLLNENYDQLIQEFELLHKFQPLIYSTDEP